MSRVRAAPVLFTKVAAVVKNVGHLEHAIFSEVIEKKMARIRTARY